VASIQPKQIRASRLKQVGVAAGMIQPKQIEAILPLLSMLDQTQSTGSVVAYDCLLLTATTDDSDGRVTTGVDLYDGVTLVSAMTEAPAGTWNYTVDNVTAGAHSYVARKVWSGGTVDSLPVAPTALAALDPSQITTATLVAWYTPNSFQMNPTLFGTRTVTVSATSGLNGRTEGLQLVVQATGVPGTGTFKSSIDNGVTFQEGSPQTIPTGAGTYAVPGTDFTLTFQQAVSYTAADVYRSTASKWLDTVGAYPNSTNNLINDASSGGAQSRPRFIAPPTATIGSTVLRFDANLGAQAFMWCSAGSIATLASGTDKKFFVGLVTDVQQAQIPAIVARRDFYVFSNLTDVDQPRISLGVNLASGDPEALFRANRVSDAGVNSGFSSGAAAAAGLYFLEDSFDSQFRSLTANAADLIGGDSGITADESGATITTTRFVFGTNQGQSGKSNGSTIDASELFIFDKKPTSEVECWQLRAYVLDSYANIPRWKCAAQVLPLISSFDGWVKNQTATYGIATNMIDDPGAPTSILTRYGYRAPRKSDNTAYPGNWYQGNSGDSAAELDVFRDQQMMLGEIGAVREILWYPNRADISVGAIPAVSDIYDASIAKFLALSEPNRNLAKITLLLQSNWAAYDGNSPGTWGNYTAFVNSWVALMLLPQYQKVTLGGISNRPVVGLYYTGTSTDWNLNLARVTTLTNAITAAGLGTPVYKFSGTVDALSVRVAASNTIGCQYFSAYLPGLSPGHVAYTNLMNACYTVDFPASLNAARAFSLAHDVDNRPRNSSNPWADFPTYTELEQFERNRSALARSATRASPNAMTSTYSANEVDEGMVFFPSEQTIVAGVNTPSRGIFLDAKSNVRNAVRNGGFPSTYTDTYMAWSFNAAVGASLPAGWALVQDLSGPSGGLTGSEQYAVIRNTTTTNARTWTVTTVGYQVYGTLGPGLGHIGVTLDGGVQIDINQDDGGGTTRYNQLLYDSGALSNASHTLAVARISGQAEYAKVRAEKNR
jgi:hypothetical protein